MRRLGFIAGLILAIILALLIALLIYHVTNPPKPAHSKTTAAIVQTGAELGSESHRGKQLAPR